MQRTLIGLVALLLLGAPGAEAQDVPVAGSWELIPGESDDINAAINAAVARMNFITRPIARRRLRSTNSAYQVVTIAQQGAETSVQYDGRLPIVGPSDGTSFRWTRDDGEVFDVTTRWLNGTLEQTFTAGDGRRQNVYAATGPDRMELRVTVTSPQLSAPLTYTLRYRRG